MIAVIVLLQGLSVDVVETIRSTGTVRALRRMSVKLTKRAVASQRAIVAAVAARPTIYFALNIAQSSHATLTHALAAGARTHALT